MSLESPLELIKHINKLREELNNRYMKDKELRRNNIMELEGLSQEKIFEKVDWKKFFKGVETLDDDRWHLHDVILQMHILLAEQYAWMIEISKKVSEITKTGDDLKQRTKAIDSIHKYVEQVEEMIRKEKEKEKEARTLYG